MKRPDGITLSALWHFAVTAVSFLGICCMSIPLIAIWSDTTGDRLIPTVALLFVAFVMLVLGGASAIGGWGLWKLRPWARMAGILLAALRLVAWLVTVVLFPVAIIEGLIIWYLWKDPDAVNALAG